MRALLQLLANNVRDAVEGWNDFWFRPTDPATLGLIRILGGGMLLYTHLIWTIDLDAFFGPDGWLSAEAVNSLQQQSFPQSFFWWLPSPAARWSVHIAALAAFACLTLGLFSRTAAILALIAAIGYIRRVPGALFGLDQINILIATYLAVGPCGAAYSLDRWWLVRRARQAGNPVPSVQPSIGANIAIRLMQLHMCVIYAFAGTSKLMGPSWWDGTAMWQSFANLEYQSLDMTWLANWPRTVNFMTHLTVLWEVYYCALIWPRRTRPWMLLLAVPLHLGIGVCLGMMTFGTVMLIGNLAFVPPEIVRAVLAWRPGQGRGAAVAVAPATVSLQNPERRALRQNPVPQR